MTGPLAITTALIKQDNFLPIKVAVADESPIFAIGIKAFIEAHPLVVFCASFLTEKALFEWYDGPDADVIIIDFNVMLPDAKATIDMLLERFPATKIIVTAIHNDFRVIEYLAEFGASAFVLRTIAPDELIKTILEVHRGEKVFPLKMTESTPGEGLVKYGVPLGLLTAREMEILKFMVLGKKTREIAIDLNISALTVKKHRENILKKLGATNTVQVILAINFEAFFKTHSRER